MSAKGEINPEMARNWKTADNPGSYIRGKCQVTGRTSASLVFENTPEIRGAGQ